MRKEHERTGLLDRMNHSLFITAHWADAKAIIKGVLFKAAVVPPSKFVRFTSDAEIRDVYVGSKAKSSKSADYEGGDVYNNIEDLVGPPDLLIVKLNEIGNPNKRAAGALAESIAHRLDRDRAVWLISCVENQFGIGSFAYSAAVYTLLVDGCDRVTVPQIIRPTDPGQGGFFTDLDPKQRADSSSVSITDSPSKEAQREERRRERDEERARQKDDAENPKRGKTIRSTSEIDTTGDSTLDSYGQGLKKNKKKSSNFGRRDD